MHGTDHLPCPHRNGFVPFACCLSEGGDSGKDDQEGQCPGLLGPPEERRPLITIQQKYHCYLPLAFGSNERYHDNCRAC